MAFAVPFALRLFGFFNKDYENRNPLLDDIPGYYKINTDSEDGPDYKDWDGLAGNDYVHKLTDENLSAFIRSPSHHRAFVLFYAPWCDHCRVTKPEFARAAQHVAWKSPRTVFGTINCDDYPRVLDHYGITHYPTIYYYSENKFIGEYNRAQTAAAFIKFMFRRPSTPQEM